MDSNIEDVTVAVDMAEMGVRPLYWYDEYLKSECVNRDDLPFSCKKSVEINVFGSQIITTNTNVMKNLFAGKEDTASDDDDDQTDFEVDPETGERIFREINPVTTAPSEIVHDSWIEEYLSQIDTNGDLPTQNVIDGITLDLNTEFLESSPSAWLSNLTNFTEMNETEFSNTLSQDNTTNNVDETENTMLSTDEQSSIESFNTVEKFEPEEQSVEISRRRLSTRLNSQSNPDEELIIRFSIPLTLDEITLSTTEQYNQYLLCMKNLSNEQLQVIKDIRRRGKNKIAAQNCRKRKAVGVESLAEEVDELKKLKEELEEQKRLFENQIAETRRKYEILHRQVLPYRQLPPAITVQ